MGTIVLYLLLSVFAFADLCSAGDTTSATLKPASMTETTANQSPVAAPAPLIELDGTISVSPDGGELSYEWKQLSGPGVELSDPHSAKPYFRTAKPGIYEFQLVVSANGLSSEPHIVRLEIEHENLPPIAKVPREVHGQVGSKLEVDGRESFDPEGQSLIYRWRPVTPGLEIPLSALSLPVLAFEPKQDGVFEVELIVSDGDKASVPAVCRMIVKARPRPPVAQARILTVGAQPTETKQETKKIARPVAQVRAVPPPNKSVTVTETSQAASVKPPASNQNQQVSPALTASGLTPYASAAEQSPSSNNNTPPIPAPPPVAKVMETSSPESLLPPLPDVDWTPSRLPPPPEVTSTSSAPVTPISVPPLGIPAPDPNPVIASTVSTSPVAAQHPDPSTSTSSLFEPAPMAPPAPPEKPRYDVMSAPTTTLPFNRPRPTARIKAPKIIEVGKPIFLDARESGNGLADSRLEYAWRQTKGPKVDALEPLYGNAAMIIRASRPATYEFELIVTDGGVQSAPITHSIRLTDQPEPPIAVVVAPTKAQLGALITMDATQSYDITGAKLLYRWRQTGGPSVRNYVLDERRGDSSPAFYPPAPGVYSFELVVSNGSLNSRPVEIDIDVSAKIRTPLEVSIAGPKKARVGEKFELSANINNSENRDLTFNWRQKGGPAPAMTPSTGTHATAIPVEAGTYTFEVSVMEEGMVAATTELGLEVERFATPKSEDKKNS